MERLTIPADRLPDGGTRIQVVDARAVREHAMELYWRLKKYEDTGLSPDDVTDLMGSHAVEVVRCKDCISYEARPNCQCGYCWHWDYETGESPNTVDGDDYCSYGERRSDNAPD